MALVPLADINGLVRIDNSSKVKGYCTVPSRCLRLGKKLLCQRISASNVGQRPIIIRYWHLGRSIKAVSVRGMAVIWLG